VALVFLVSPLLCRLQAVGRLPLVVLPLVVLPLVVLPLVVLAV
jgi:hypothetical protein